MAGVIEREKDETRSASDTEARKDARADAQAAEAAAKERRPTLTARMQVRAADIEPYIGLKYLSRLFKLMAVILILLLVSEIVTGLVKEGIDALPTLLGEVSKLVVFAGLLWGSGDLAILLIDMGHDLRATRILIGRQLAHHMDEHHARIDPGVTSVAPNEPAQPI